MAPATGFIPTARGRYCTMVTDPVAVMEGSTTELALEIRVPLLSVNNNPATISGWYSEPLAGSLVNVTRRAEHGGFSWDEGHSVMVLNPEY